MKGQNPVFKAANADTSITIRDYIAIQAMTGLLAGISAAYSSQGKSMPPYELIAQDCYNMADAMIKQSEVRDVN